MTEETGDLLMFVHQDVYLPPGWVMALQATLQWLQQTDPNWGVIGVFGVGKDGSRRGHVYSTGLGAELGEQFSTPMEAISLDELLLITRRTSGLRFDDGLPGFHLYGTDICLEAAKRGMKNYIVPAFCIHNSNGLKYLPKPFWEAYLYIRNKWKEQLPIRTSCTTITRGCGPLIEAAKSGVLRWLRKRKIGTRCEDPSELYRSLRHLSHV
jgi:hypothetical protein